MSIRQIDKDIPAKNNLKFNLLYAENWKNFRARRNVSMNEIWINVAWAFPPFSVPPKRKSKNLRPLFTHFLYFSEAQIELQINIWTPRRDIR